MSEKLQPFFQSVQVNYALIAGYRVQFELSNLPGCYAASAEDTACKNLNQNLSTS